MEDVPTSNGNIMSDINLAFREHFHNFEKKNSTLRLGKKIYEFYTAPVSKFWVHSVSVGVVSASKPPWSLFIQKVNFATVVYSN